MGEYLFLGVIRPGGQGCGVPIEISLPYMVERAVRHPVPLIVGNEELILWAHSNPAGGAESGSEWLEVPVSVGAVDPPAPGGIVRHIAPADPLRFPVRYGKFPAGTEVERGIFSAERISHRSKVIFMVLPGYTKLIGHGFVAVTDTILVGIDQAGKFRFLSDIVSLFLLIPKDTIGFH